MDKRAKETETIKIMRTIKRKRKENKMVLIKRRKVGEIFVQWH